MGSDIRFDLPSVSAAAWRGRIFFLEIIVVCWFVAIIFIHMQKPLYTAVAIIAQEQGQQDGLLHNNSTLKALSSLTGKEGDEDSDIDEFLKRLTTPAVSEKFMERASVMPHVFNARFDEKRNLWILPDGFLSSVKNILYPIIGVSPVHSVSQFDLSDYVSHRVLTSKDRITSLISISYSDRDPVFAVQFLTGLLNVADEMMRDAIKVRTGNNVKSLRRMLSSLNNADLKLSLIAILQSQEQKYMLASSGDTYAFRYVQPPTTSGRETWPAVGAIMAVATIIGVLISFVLSLFLYLPDELQFASGRYLRMLRSSGSFVAALFSGRYYQKYV